MESLSNHDTSAGSRVAQQSIVELGTINAVQGNKTHDPTENNPTAATKYRMHSGKTGENRGCVNC